MSPKITNAINALVNALREESPEQMTVFRLFVNCEERIIETAERTPAELKATGISMRNLRGNFIRENAKKCATRRVTAGCSKCGSSDIHRKYYAEGEDTNGVWPNRKGKSSAWVNRKDAYFQPALHECIVHTCRCCGYSWDSDSLPNSELSNNNVNSLV